MERRDKINYYLDIAEAVTGRGTCLYLVGLENRTGGYVEAAAPCSLCKRMIINAGIERVIVRDTRDTYRTFEVDEEWVAHDDSIEGTKGY